MVNLKTMSAMELHGKQLKWSPRQETFQDYVKLIGGHGQLAFSGVWCVDNPAHFVTIK